MKKLFAILITAVLVVACAFTLVACAKDNEIDIWVGSESKEFYQKIADEYIAQYNQAHPEEPFPFTIKVTGGDISGYADTVSRDTESGPDIFTVPHDNLGKMLGDRPFLAPITDEALLAQIDNDNPDTYKTVIKNRVNDEEYMFGVPYIGQALVLFYDKTEITEEEVKTWEGISAAAKRQGAKAAFPMGNDCYNLSLFTLARAVRDPEGNAIPFDQQTSVKLYEPDPSVTAPGLEDYIKGVNFTGDDTVAVYHWAQRFFANPNGMMLQNDEIQTTISNNKAITLIGGAWKFNDVKAAWGENLAVAELPEFTITELDEYGTCKAGTVFKSGTFADCKVMCINGGTKAYDAHYPYLQDILKYLTSKDVQERSFEECNNLPTYKNASTEFDAMKADTVQAQLAQKQVDMMQYGIPQPFGFDTLLNNLFYSKGADTILQDILMQKDSAQDGVAAYNNFELLKAGLKSVQDIWDMGLNEEV